MNLIELKKELISDHGKLTWSTKDVESFIMRLKLTSSMFDQIEVLTNLYTNKDEPDFNNWTDVEGMGYGWLWAAYEDKEHLWYKKLLEYSIRQVKLLEYIGGFTQGYVFKDKNRITLVAICLEDERREVIISLFNEEG